MRTQGEHIRTLQRRVDFLKAREHRNSYDQAELGALEWALVNLPPAQQEPVAWGVDWGKAGDIPCVSIIKRLPGGGIEVVAVEYNPPAKRTWVGLSDEESTVIWANSQSVDEAIRATEKQLMENNI